MDDGELEELEEALQLDSSLPGIPDTGCSRPHPTPSATGNDKIHIGEGRNDTSSLSPKRAPEKSFILPPSADIRSGVPRSLRNLIGTELFHFFLSYRVSTEGPMMESVYDSILRLSEDEKKIPQGAKGKWPRFATVPQDCHRFTVKGFLDKRCLRDGKDWEAGFVLGLMHSLVFVPIMSGFKSDQAAKHVIDEVGNGRPLAVDAKDSIYRGSVGDMVGLDTNDKVDNVLLEYIIAWHWLRKEGTYLQSIYPIMVGKKLPNGTYENFDMSLIDKLPQRPSHKTNETAALILEMMGVEDREIREMKQRTVKQIVQMMLKHQGIIMTSDMAANGNIHDFLAHKIMDVIIRDIRILQYAPSEFAFKRPGGHEVLQWLCERSLLKLSRTFAEHDVDSSLKMSQLTEIDIHDMFREEVTARESSIKLRKGMLTTLRAAIEELRKSKMANKYSTRLMEYRDSKTALGTAVWTSNSAEIACGKWQVQFIWICLAAIFFNSAIDNLNGKMTKWRKGEPYGVILWAKCIWYIPFWISNGFFFLKAAYEGRYKTPHTARITLEKQIKRCIILLMLGLIAEIAQILFKQHDPEWTLDKTFSIGGIIFEIILYLPPCIVAWWSIRYRQELWIPSWAGLGLLVGVIIPNSFFFDDAFQNPSYFILILVFFVSVCVCFVYFGLAKQRTERIAKEKNKWRAERFIEEWKRVVIVNEGIPAQDLPVSFEMVITKGPLKDLWEMTKSIQVKLKNQYCESRSRVSGLRRLISTQTRTIGYDRFAVRERKTLYGKFRQSTSDFDRLFEQASSLNSAVHDLLSDLISPLQEDATEQDSNSFKFEHFPCLKFAPIKQPDRTIQKCVRSYRRDAGCLTDLVRCTIIVETIDQLLRLFKLFQNRSIFGEKCVERFHLLGVDVQDDTKSRESLGSSQLDHLQEDIYFCITRVKNRFHHKSEHYDPATGYRDLSLNLEVGWHYESDTLTLLPVQEWSKGVTLQVSEPVSGFVLFCMYSCVTSFQK